MVRLCNEPVLFNQEQVDIICKTRNAEYVVDTEHKGIPCSVFYGLIPHPDSGSRYFALYRTPVTGELMITNGAFVEDQTFTGVIADNGDIIFSRSRHDYRTSDDESVFVDGGRDYIRCNALPQERFVKLTVFKGRLEVWFDNE